MRSRRRRSSCFVRKHCDVSKKYISLAIGLERHMILFSLKWYLKYCSHTMNRHMLTRIYDEKCLSSLSDLSKKKAQKSVPTLEKSSFFSVSLASKVMARRTARVNSKRTHLDHRGAHCAVCCRDSCPNLHKDGGVFAVPGGLGATRSKVGHCYCCIASRTPPWRCRRSSTQLPWGTHPPVIGGLAVFAATPAVSNYISALCLCKNSRHVCMLVALEGSPWSLRIGCILFPAHVAEHGFYLYSTV